MSDNKKQSVQDLQRQIDAVLVWFEADDIAVDEAVEKYEQAMKLLAELESILESTALKIKKLESQYGIEG